MNNIRIVPMTADQLDALEQLERTCFSRPWSRKMLAEELDNECAAFLVAEDAATGEVIGSVAGNPNAIGYASLSAVEGKSTVKALTVNGVACTEATVLDGSYEIQRPFVLVTKEGVTLSAAAQAFFDFATSAAASDLIKNAGAVPVAK